MINNTMMPQTEDWLNEENLGVILKWLFPKYDIIHDECLPNIKQKIRPDYRIEEIKLIIEFDGIYHYTTPTSCISDIFNTKTYESMGYHVIRLPYFIQLHKDIILNLFKNYISDDIIDYTVDYNLYPHGFINHKNVYPAQYCSMGLVRFKEDCVKFQSIVPDIYYSIGASLMDSVIRKQSLLSVIPIHNLFSRFIDGLFEYSESKNIKLSQKIIDEVSYVITKYKMEMSNNGTN